MKLHRIQVKAFVRDASRIDLSALVPIFHKWIRTDAIDDLLIDVANYEHVPNGPGIVLIAHEGDYALDQSSGRVGLQYTRKRDVPGTTAEALDVALRRLFAAARLLEEDESLNESYQFRTDEVEIRFLDRLQIPNRPESLDVVRDAVENVMKGFYGVSELDVERIEDDPRLPFAVRVKLPANPDVSLLAQRFAVRE